MLARAQPRHNRRVPPDSSRIFRNRGGAGGGTPQPAHAWLIQSEGGCVYFRTGQQAERGHDCARERIAFHFLSPSENIYVNQSLGSLPRHKRPRGEIGAVHKSVRNRAVPIPVECLTAVGSRSST